MATRQNFLRAPAPGREIQLLPRHWQWLDEQPRSASATLRLLVERARRDEDGRLAAEAARERCYEFIRDMAGDRPNFEEACRALFAGKPAAFAALTAAWPTEIQVRARELATPAWPTATPEGTRQDG